ncbi:MFS transporter [Sporolactobacillus kofuensis]|uniref:MFS transporter n=1 Tax=Sporolactobacillus kofuensis TaxID=269672 RepID=A0ABW1WAP6_9BACL|nr:MFS transporter [Sporolactobacillus kofuensis]MCO7174757.1 MFS transporter [Sporolactobacillus kofuensis]
MMKGLIRNKNFMILFIGRLITNIGDSMYYIAAMWLVYKLGGSAFYSGLAGFLTMLPQALQFICGPMIDRSSIRKLLINTQLIQALLLSIIPIAYRFHVLSISLILIIMPLAAFLNQFSFPAENALIPRILPRDQRVSANSLMSVAVQGTDAAFNAISGVLVALVGAMALYTADIITFLITALLFAALQLPENHVEKANQSLGAQTKRYFIDLKEGFQLVLHSLLGKILVAGAITNFAFGAMMASLPAYADSLGGAKTYGFLLAGMSIGVLVGAAIAGLFERFAFGHLMVISYAAGFIFWIGSALIPIFILKIVLFAMSMVPIGLNNVLSFAMMQNVIPEKLLARSVSVMASISSCIMPLGSLLGGSLAALFGPQLIFTLTSVSLLFIAVYVSLVPILRRIPSVHNVCPDDFGF